MKGNEFTERHAEIMCNYLCDLNEEEITEKVKVLRRSGIDILCQSAITQADMNSGLAAKGCHQYIRQELVRSYKFFCG